MTDKQSNTITDSSLTSNYLDQNSLNVSQISRYAAAAGAGLAMAGAADASIIYSGVQNITVQIDPAFQATSSSISSSNISSIGIDIDNDGTDDIGAVALNVGTLSGSTSVKYLGGAFLVASSSANFLNNVASSNADILANSNNVGSAGSFSANNAGQYRTSFISSSSAGSSTYGASFVSNTAFVGIQLGSGNFGWIRLLIEDLGPNQPFRTLLGGTPLGDGINFADKITVVDWAFEDTGADIHVGDTGRAIPEPSSLALLAAGAAGISAFRRRKSHKKA